MDDNKLKLLLRKQQKAEDENNQPALAEACQKLGNYYMSEAHLKKALQEFQRESEIHHMLCKKMDYARAHRMIGEVFLLQGNYQEALKHEDIYMKIAKQENDLVEMQRAYATVGRCFLLQAEDKSSEGSKDASSDFKASEKAFLKSLIICKELGKLVSKWELADMQARLYLNLGVTKEHIQDYDEAISYYDTAIKICKENDLFELHHQCLMASGMAFYYKRDDFSIALQQLNAALEVSKRIQDKNEKMCETLLAKSGLLVKNGDFQSAKQVLKKAYKLKSPNKGDKEQIQNDLKLVLALSKYEDELVTTSSFDYKKRKELFEKLGDGSCKLKNFTKGIDFYLKMLEAAQLNGESDREMIPIYVSLYQTYIDKKDYDLALEYMNKEYDLIRDEPEEACATLLALGNLLDLAGKDFWEVDTIYRRGIEDAKKAEKTEIEKTLIRKLIQLCKKRSMISLAEMLEREAIEKGIELIEPSEDMEFSEDIAGLCDDISLELQLSSDPESSDNEQNRLPNTSGTSTRKRRPAMTVKKNAKGETKLHEACISGNYQVAKMLIDQGHAINVRDNAGWLPLHEAAIHGFRDVAELLLDNGAQSAINDKGGTKCDGITPLYDASSNGNLSVVQLLLDRGAKATVRTDFNETPLDALIRWHGDYGHKLSAGESDFFETIKSRLTEQCERIGLATTSKNAHTGSSGYNSAKSRSSQSSLQRKSLRRNTSFSSESEAEESTKENADSITKSARLEYKNVMSRLKNRNKDQRFVPEDSVEVKKRSAHLTVQEVDPDEWLEDDLAPSRKKQKFRSDESPDKFAEKHIPVKTTTPKKTILANTSSYLIDSDSENEMTSLDTYNDAFNVVMNAGGAKSKQKRRVSTTKSYRKPTSQPSLLDSGFARFVDNEELPAASPIKISSSSTLCNESFSRVNAEEKKLIIKVQVESEKIIVPISKDSVSELQISWLIEEAARRYYCLKGIQPELKLKTSDGATLLNTDPVSLILSLAEENLIYSEILDWKLPSLSKRYLEACSEFKCSVDHEINEHLEINRCAIRLDFSNQNLTPATVRPIMKALQHQSCLLQLDLSSNFIQNEGLKFLSQTLVTLKQLSLLDVSGNMITENGIEHMCNAILKCQSLVELKQLKLSYNPIRSTSVKFIGALCVSKKLESLSLAGCELTDALRLEHLSTIKHLDISYNFLSSEAIKNLMNSLNASVVETLNLERCSSEYNLGDSLVMFINAGCFMNLKEINLAGLNFTENEILDVIRALEKCEKLESLDLSHHKQLNFLTLKYILLNLESNSLERVKLIGCRNLQTTSNLCNFSTNCERRQTRLRSVQLSLPNDSTKADFIAKLRELWESLSGNRGTTNLDKGTLHLIRYDDEREIPFHF